VPTPPDKPTPRTGAANPDWHSYRTGGLDKAGREIEKVYALDDSYVIYFSDCELFYETTSGLVKDLGSTNAALARINRLLPDNPPDKESYQYKNKFSTLELVADACEMVFCGEMTEALEILNGIRDKLQTTEEGKRRLMYQAGSVAITCFIWVAYLVLLPTISSLRPAWEPWILAAALALAGGVFSVCLNLGSLEVSVNQQKPFLFSAGATRSVVALLAGIAVLLAMRSKMFAGIVYNGQPPAVDAPLTIAEMFFCFLAGFSESFVPNILRDSEKKLGEKPKPTESSGGGAAPEPDGEPGEPGTPAEDTAPKETAKVAETPKPNEPPKPAEPGKANEAAKPEGVPNMEPAKTTETAGPK